jgi:hypothetical protein
MRFSHLFYSAALFVVVICAGAESARADELISLAFNSPNSVGPGPAPISGPESTATSANPLFGAANDWNNVNITFGVLTTNPSWSNLVDSTGASTGVNFSITGTVLGVNLFPYFPGQDPLRSEFIAWNSNSSGGGAAGAGESTSIDWTLTGLAPNATFDMCVYGSISGTSRSFDMSIGGKTLNIPTFASATPQQAGCVLFSSIISNASGDLSGVGTGLGSSAGAANEANWSGFQLVQVPHNVAEPSGLVLLLAGILAFAGLSMKKFLL